MARRSSRQTLSPSQKTSRINELLGRDGGRCVWCSAVLVRGENLTLDHIRPASQSGSWALQNLLLACLDCNGERKDSDVLDWAVVCRDEGRAVRTGVLAAAVSRAESPLVEQQAYREHCAARRQAERDAADLRRLQAEQRIERQRKEAQARRAAGLDAKSIRQAVKAFRRQLDALPSAGEPVVAG